MAVRVRLLAHFSLHGAVLSLSASDHLALHIRGLSPDDHLSYRVSPIRDLDEIPRTVQTVMPVLHPDAPRVTDVKHVSIDFILAPDGTVRVPAVQSADDGWRAAAAIEALRQWRYTPPTVKGKPVYANFVQVITFQPNYSEAQGGCFLRRGMRGFRVASHSFTLLLVVILLSSFGLSHAESISPMKILRNFDPSSESAAWLPQNDGVMGGVSTGRAEIREGNLYFTGELSLENNGGFAQVYSKTEASDFSAYSGIRLRVKGDGRVYQFRLEGDARFRGSPIAYWSAFPTQAGQWIEVSLPFSSLMPTYRGQALSGPALDLSSIRQIAFLLADGTPGGFSLIVDWIGFE